jgi:hypothetical protein
MVHRCAIIECHFLPEMRDALLHGAGIPGIFFPIYCTVLQKNVKGSGIFGQFGKTQKDGAGKNPAAKRSRAHSIR